MTGLEENPECGFNGVGWTDRDAGEVSVTASRPGSEGLPVEYDVVVLCHKPRSLSTCSATLSGLLPTSTADSTQEVLRVRRFRYLAVTVSGPTHSSIPGTSLCVTNTSKILGNDDTRGGVGSLETRREFRVEARERGRGPRVERECVEGWRVEGESKSRHSKEFRPRFDSPEK